MVGLTNHHIKGHKSLPFLTSGRRKRLQLEMTMARTWKSTAGFWDSLLSRWKGADSEPSCPLDLNVGMIPEAGQSFCNHEGKDKRLLQTQVLTMRSDNQMQPTLTSSILYIWQEQIPICLSHVYIRFSVAYSGKHSLRVALGDSKQVMHNSCAKGRTDTQHGGSPGGVCCNWWSLEIKTGIHSRQRDKLLQKS